MTGTGIFVYREDAEGGGIDTDSPADASAVLSAVREDIRQTLRVGWIDPAIDAAAAFPVFFTAAWSAIRPNVGKTFLLLTRAVRSQAVETVRASLDPPDLRRRLESVLSDEELRRVEDSARAAHLASAKAQIVVLALHRAARRERIPGTGREEPPIRRGVPDWQRWMSPQAPSESVRLALEEAMTVMGAAAPPMPLRLFSRWPGALDVLWGSLRDVVRSDPWRSGTSRVRRVGLSGISSLPHAVDLQWGALKARGFQEEQRKHLVDVLAAHDAAMSSQTLASAFAWAALGAPDIVGDG